jgi:hypothetical protein
MKSNKSATQKTTPKPAYKRAAKPRKKSSVRHTRAIQLARIKTPTVAPPDEKVEQLLTEVVQPATFAQVAHFQRLGLRERTLTLPVMVALVLSLLWRQIGAVREAVRVLQREGLLWSAPLAVSQQAVSERLRTLPPELFAGILHTVVPTMQQRWQARQRPHSLPLQWALRSFDRVQALDGSTLDALVRRVGLLRDLDKAPLAGRMAALLDLGSRLPAQVWFEEDPKAHDQQFWERVLSQVTAKTLLLFNLGFLNFTGFDRLCEQQVGFITRAKSNTVCKIVEELLRTPTLRDSLVRVGTDKNPCQHLLRLVEVQHNRIWYRYLTNVLDPKVLPAAVVAALYWQRWRIEDAFGSVKRLLGLAYFYVGSANGVQSQVWCTWLLYAVLMDLTDQVAEAMHQPTELISVEMVYRGLYHFTQASHKGKATDPIKYLADPKNKDLGILKRPRKDALTAKWNLTIPLLA